jgi:hypothetical protein
MQLDDYTSRGHLRRWDLLDGQPRCPLNPVDPARISDADRAAILAKNAAVRAKVEAVEAYEAALRAQDEEAASNATQETLELAAIRAGADPEREPDPIPEDTIVLLQPVPQEVTETQFIRACVHAGIITAAEGVAYLARGELPAMMEAALEILPEAARTDATLKAIGSASFSRTDGVFDALAASEVATAAQIDDVFRLAATLS